MDTKAHIKERLKRNADQVNKLRKRRAQDKIKAMAEPSNPQRPGGADDSTRSR